jgi:hypothetical protein
MRTPPSKSAQLRLAFKKRGRRRPDLIRDTGLIPFAAAQIVVEEISRFLGVPLPCRFAVRLSAQAVLIYANSESFRRKLRGPGERGRDLLYLFMRHWLAARLQSERPAWFHRLPASYCVGAVLPEKFPREALVALGQARRLDGLRETFLP